LNKRLKYDFNQKRKSFANSQDRQSSLSKNTREKSLTKKNKGKYLNIKDAKDSVKMLSNLEPGLVQYVKAFYDKLSSKNNLSEMTIKSKSKALNDAENSGNTVR
jgi:hypothetical protein